MNVSPRLKFGLLVGGVGLVVRARISLIFSLGSGGEGATSDEFTTNIQQAVPESEQNTDQQDIKNADNKITNNKTTPPPLVTQVPGSSITVLVPPIIEKKSWEYLHRAINTKSQQETRLLYYPTWELYARTVRETLLDSNRHDVVLIPSIWYESFVDNTMQFQLQENMKSLFHPITMEWLFNDHIAVIPFALDPFVIGAHEPLTQPVNVAAIVARRNTLPTFFGFAVSQRQGATTRGTVASQALLHDALVKVATTGAKRRVSFLLLGADATPGSPSCNGLVSWCAFTEKLITTTIAPLSEFATLDHQPLLYNVPVGTTSYPIVGRGFVVPSTSDNQAAAAQRLASYLELSANGELIYPPYLLSASIRTLQRQRIEHRYKNIQEFFNAQSLLVGSIDQTSLATLSLIDSYQNGAVTLNYLLQEIGDRL